MNYFCTKECLFLFKETVSNHSLANQFKPDNGFVDIIFLNADTDITGACSCNQWMLICRLRIILLSTICQFYTDLGVCQLFFW